MSAAREALSVRHLCAERTNASHPPRQEEEELLGHVLDLRRAGLGIVTAPSLGALLDRVAVCLNTSMKPLTYFDTLERAGLALLIMRSMGAEALLEFAASDLGGLLLTLPVCKTLCWRLVACARQARAAAEARVNNMVASGSLPEGGVMLEIFCGDPQVLKPIQLPPGWRTRRCDIRAYAENIEVSACYSGSFLSEPDGFGLVLWTEGPALFTWRTPDTLLEAVRSLASRGVLMLTFRAMEKEPLCRRVARQQLQELHDLGAVQFSEERDDDDICCWDVTVLYRSQLPSQPLPLDTLRRIDEVTLAGAAGCFVSVDVLATVGLNSQRPYPQERLSGWYMVFLRLKTTIESGDAQLLAFLRDLLEKRIAANWTTAADATACRHLLIYLGRAQNSINQRCYGDHLRSLSKGSKVLRRVREILPDVSGHVAAVLVTAEIRTDLLLAISGTKEVVGEVLNMLACLAETVLLHHGSHVQQNSAQRTLSSTSAGAQRSAGRVSTPFAPCRCLCLLRRCRRRAL